MGDDSGQHGDLRRRDLIRFGLLGTGAALAGPAWLRSARGGTRDPGPADDGLDADTVTQARRRVRPRRPAEIPDFEFDETSVAALQHGMGDGRYTARSIAEAYLERVEAIDKRGPAVNAIIEINPDALEIADELDLERAEGNVRGPLHGIPVMIKDNIDTGDRMQTTAGSLALAGEPAPRDACVAERLRAAGAVILAKTNLSEWANFRSTRSSSGWSGRGGQTRNPHALDRTPSGSSSGSGVAVASNLCAVAIGTETDGSVVSPASINGIVGIKPTVGLVGRSGIIPISHSQDTAGTMGRTVADAAALLGALTGVDPRDPATGDSQGKFHGDYATFLDPDGLRGARVGVLRDFAGFHEAVDEVFEDAIAAMKEAGAEIIDPVELTTREEFGDAEFEIMLYEFKAGLNVYLATRPSLAAHDPPIRSLEDLIVFNEANAAVEMPYFRQEIMEMAQEKGPLTDDAYVEALDNCRRLSRDEGIDALLAEHRLDALVAPTDGPAGPIDLILGDHWIGGSSSPAAVSGYASITVPMGHVFGLPVGMSLFAGAWSEPTLIRLAHAFERRTAHRRPPRFLPTADLKL